MATRKRNIHNFLLEDLGFNPHFIGTGYLEVLLNNWELEDVRNIDLGLDAAVNQLKVVRQSVKSEIEYAIHEAWLGSVRYSGWLEFGRVLRRKENEKDFEYFIKAMRLLVG